VRVTLDESLSRPLPGLALTAVAYFDLLPSNIGALVAGIAARCAASIGDVDADCFVAFRRAPREGPVEMVRGTTLSEIAESVSELSAEQISTISIAAPSNEADVFDVSFWVSVDRDNILGLPADPTLVLKIDGSLLQRAGDPLLMVQNFWKWISEAGGCYQGFVDISPADETGSSLIFSRVPGNPRTLQRGLELWEWLLADAVQRRGRVRGTPWGTYLGPELAKTVDRLGPIDIAYCRQSRDGDFRPQTAIRLDGGAVFLTLTGNPLDYSTDTWSVHPVAVDNMLWLRAAFAHAGVLWQGLPWDVVRRQWDNP
jgi:hypothetical protein